MRYEQLIRAVRAAAPKVIVEVGTWNGARALEMLRVAPEGCRYFGFDLFEEATADTDRDEKNVKKHWSLAQVAERLDGYDATLIRGNTRDTLPAMAPTLPPIEFLWLDGGHSIDTISSDWEALRTRLAPGAKVFLDDYYTGGINTERYGCNQLVATLPHRLLPACDPVMGGGFVHMVEVLIG